MIFRCTRAAATVALLFALAPGLAACGDDARGGDSGVDAAAADVGADAVADTTVDTVTPPPDAAPLFKGTIKGIVVDETGAAVADALVRFGGRPETARSAADGRFTLVVGDPPVELLERALTAGKPGFRSGGVAVENVAAEQRIVVTKVTLVDNPKYAFKSPDDNDATPDCLHCHKNQVTPWQKSGHAGAAKNPRLHDVYNGTASGITSAAACAAAGGRWLDGKALGSIAVIKKCYVAGGGVLSALNSGCGGAGQASCDDPRRSASNVAGSCADCHAAASAGHVAGNTDLNRIDDLTHRKGIHCDFCHKIAEVKVNDRAGVDGAITLLRPSSKVGGGGFAVDEIMFGPLSDVIVSVMGNVYQPQFTKSELCSACHQWLSYAMRPADKGKVDSARWPGGLPLQDTYYEWSQSPAKAAGTQCQHCHMPAKPYQTAAADLVGTRTWTNGVFGWKRPLGQAHSHAFLPRLPPLGAGEKVGPGEPSRDSLRAPITLAVKTTRGSGALTVDLALTNDGAGHSIPTGTPSRQLLLLVTADVGGSPLRASGGYSVPAWVGAYVTAVIGGSGGATLSGTQLTLPAGKQWPADAAKRVVRFVEPTGGHAAYPATRWFAAKSAAEQGMPIEAPRATARIVAVNGQTATLDAAPTVAAGTRVIVGDALPDLARKVDDTLPVSAVGGAAGWVFGKLMKDSAGAVGVEFFKAVDIASDNRIPAGAKVTTQHVFDVGASSGAAGKAVRVRVVLLYRKYPWGRSRERGWVSSDAVRLVREVSVQP